MESQDLPITIGSAIFRLRESRRLAVLDCAKRSGLSADEWSSIEAGNSDLPIDVMWRIADALDLRPSQLMRLIECGYPDNETLADSGV